MPTAEVESHTPPPVAAPPSDPPATPAKHAGGRPARVRERTEESSAEEQTGFFQEVSEVTETDWERTVMYLYRWQPFYDMTKGGIEPKYVCLFTSAVTIDDIKKQHGSGRYNLKLNRKEANQRSDKTVRQIVFDILDPSFPPNLPDGDWKQDARNKKWVWGKAEAPVAGQPGGTGIASALKDVQAMMQALYPNLGSAAKSSVEAELVKILPALLEQRNSGQQQMDPMALITTIVSLVKTMIPAPVAPTPPDNTMTQFILTQLNLANERAEKQNALIITLIQQKAEPVKQPDAMDMLDRMAGIFGKVSDVRETLGVGGAASRMNGWQEVLSNVGTEVIKTIGPVLPFMLRGNGQPARPAAPAPARLPGAAPPAPPPAPPPGTPPAEATAAAPDPLQEEDVDAASFLANQMQSLGIIGPMLTYFNDGETGLRFAMWVADGYGAMPLNLIKGQGKATVLRAVSENLPQLYAQLQPNWGKFDLFVDSFLTWTPDAELPEEDELPDEDEDETLPVSATAPATPPAPPSGTPPAPPPSAPPAKARAPKKTVTKKKVAK